MSSEVDYGTASTSNECNTEDTIANSQIRVSQFCIKTSQCRNASVQFTGNRYSSYRRSEGISTILFWRTILLLLLPLFKFFSVIFVITIRELIVVSHPQRVGWLLIFIYSTTLEITQVQVIY